MAKRQSFYDVITEAVADIAAHGYDSVERLDEWMRRIRIAARASMTPEETLRRELERHMRDIFARMVERSDVLKVHKGISRGTLAMVKPHLRQELDRRIVANANLIRLRRDEAIEATIRRFAGWATAIPIGGSDAVERRKAKEDVRRSMSQLPFVERRVVIDQGHKLAAAISDIVATDGNAIAASWHSHWRQAGYDYREDHKERDDLVYAIRGNWAIEAGLMKRGRNPYTDEITKPAEEPFCRCKYVYLYALRDLPSDMLTAKGRATLERVRLSAA